ncbi:MAG: class I mannose-6-phosphate isomerase [Silvanigrellales bacterium]|nr:class I mannose-6-phosphate isomerase [Silvanigrellales bacterium]
MAPKSFDVLVMDALNFVPLTRTPWAGHHIPRVKARGLGLPGELLPQRVGESWEVSTDTQFPSRVPSHENRLLSDVLETHGASLLGASVLARYGNHCPLLLKWLHASDVLSVQLHPRNGHRCLAAHECGKPESWLVMAVEPGGHLYLGFRESVTPAAVREALAQGRPETVLFRYVPAVGDLVAIPPGLVHAVGPGVFLAEPQYVLPGRSGKTWRLSDWGRTYDAQGALCRAEDGGRPRELHIEEAFGSIDWALPRGEEAVRQLVRATNETAPFRGDTTNPFATWVFTSPGPHVYDALVGNAFSLVSCYAGTVSFGSTTLRMGESGLVPATAARVPFVLQAGEEGRCGVAFFALASEVLDGVPE